MNVAVVGCGVRGSILAALLAGAGVEEISLIDGGHVAEQDIGLHPLQFAPDLRAVRAEALAFKLNLISPSVLAVPFPANLDQDNAEAILAGADCIADCAGSEAVTQSILDAVALPRTPVVAPPGDYNADEISPARAVAIGALQADLVIGLRGEEPDLGSAPLLRTITV